MIPFLIDYDDYASNVWSFLNIFPKPSFLYRREFVEVMQDCDMSFNIWETKYGSTDTEAKYYLHKEFDRRDVVSANIAALHSYKDRRTEYIRFINEQQ